MVGEGVAAFFERVFFFSAFISLWLYVGFRGERVKAKKRVDKIQQAETQKQLMTDVLNEVRELNASLGHKHEERAETNQFTFQLLPLVIKHVG